MLLISENRKSRDSTTYPESEYLVDGLPVPTEAIRQTRREFTPEYKDEAVKLVTTTGRAVATVARELGINEATLGRWVTAFKARNETGQTEVTESERAELLRLRKENAELKMDRAFLKKASIFFAQEASDTNGKRSN